FQDLATRGTLDLHLVSRHPEAAWEGPVVELQHKIAAAVLIRRNYAGDVEPPVLIRRRFQTPCCHHTHAGQAIFAVVLHSVAIDVVEDLAKHVCTIERLIRDDTNPCGRLTGQRLARQTVDDLRAVDELAFPNTGANGEQQDDRASGAAEAEAIPRELAGGNRGF